MKNAPDWELDALWEKLRTLHAQTPKGKSVGLSRSVIHLMRRVAPSVGVSNEELEVALAHPRRATALVREMWERVRVGSDRIGDALDKMYDLQEVGDLAGARKVMSAVLAVEVVPLYRDIAANEIVKMDTGNLDMSSATLKPERTKGTAPSVKRTAKHPAGKVAPKKPRPKRKATPSRRRSPRK